MSDKLFVVVSGSSSLFNSAADRCYINIIMRSGVCIYVQVV